jgi:acyl-ACP thioesterase
MPFSFHSEQVEIYSLHHDIHYGETDPGGKLSLPAAFSLMQEAAVRHADGLGIGQDFCVRTGSMWILSRVDVRISELPSYRDLVTVETWTRGAAGPFALRDYRIVGADGRTLIDGTSNWILLDVLTIRPRNPVEVLRNIPVPAGLRTLPENASRLSDGAEVSRPHPAPVAAGAGTFELQSAAVRDAGIESRIYRPVYSDIDGHDHVNNAQYVRWCLDMLDTGWHRRNAVRWFSINYLKAAGIGDVLEIGMDTDGDAIRFHGTLASGERCFLARMSVAARGMQEEAT